jgi:hypothetical protein
LPPLGCSAFFTFWWSFNHRLPSQRRYTGTTAAQFPSLLIYTSILRKVLHFQSDCYWARCLFLIVLKMFMGQEMAELLVYLHYWGITLTYCAKSVAGKVAPDSSGPTVLLLVGTCGPNCHYHQWSNHKLQWVDFSKRTNFCWVSVTPS